MEKDSRRAQGQWRGCYAFDNIIYDRDGQSSSTRKGGLKMGQTYWYYYKLDGEIETHDSTLPSTTACPFLPGQSMNLLSVPVEEGSVRNRSASVGSEAEPLKTMDPYHKFETPRPPPATPKLARLKTSTGCENSRSKKATRSESPKFIRSPWSPRALFTPKSPGCPLSNHSREPVLDVKDGDANISHPVLISRTDEGRKCVSLEEIQRQKSKITVRKAPPSDRSKLLPRINLTPWETNDQPSQPERANSPPKLNLAALETVDDEDDANFACCTSPRRDYHPTILTPPPVRGDGSRGTCNSSEHEPTLRLLNANLSEFYEKSKPLPCIPNPEKECDSENPSPNSIHAALHLASENDSIPCTNLHAPASTLDWIPQSHFSLDSLDEMLEACYSGFSEPSDPFSEHTETDITCGGMLSPTNSQYSSGCASPSSIIDYDMNNDTVPALNLDGLGIGVAIGCEADFDNLAVENLQAKAVSPTRSEFQYNPIINEVSSRGFHGYSLPDPDEYGSQQSLMQEVAILKSEEEIAELRTGRATFGGPLSSEVDGIENLGGALQGLLDELGYLGEAINN